MQQAAKPAIMHNATTLDTAARLRNAFDVFDVDKSGSLSAEELRAVLTRPGGGQAMSEEDAAKLLKEFDINGDGVLDVDEFVLMMSGLKPGARFGGAVVDSAICVARAVGAQFQTRRSAPSAWSSWRASTLT